MSQGPDLVSRVSLVTGATAGIGLEIARGLAGMGATVVLGCRSLDRGQAALDQIARTTGSQRLSLLVMDLADQASIRKGADELKRRHDRLHILVNNAGVFLPRRQASPDGIELTWATNVLGYHLLTALLLDLLKASAPSRIVNVASEMAGGLDLTDLQFERRGFEGRAAYSQSKQANRMLTWHLARGLERTGVTANALHPGWVRTDIVREANFIVRGVVRLAALVAAKTPQAGADTAIWLASSPDVLGVTGKFFVNRRERTCRFRDDAASARLSELCDEMTRARA
jgi:NAD(P)-dependent dehydrogenase (short-subunit alcohol dehydrogenase family)